MKTDIVLVLDESGSMQPRKEATIEGVNKLIETQQKLPEKAKFTLVTFNSNHTRILDRVKLKDVKPLAYEDYNPNSMTALLDTLWVTIKAARKSQKKTGNKVILAIMTDGEENASTKHRDRLEVANLITKAQEKWGWDIFFLAANIDTFSEASSLGIPQAAAMSYNIDTNKGVTDAYEAMAAGMTMGRLSSERTNTDDSWKTD